MADTQTITTTDELFEHIESQVVQLELSIFDLATLKGVVDTALGELYSEKDSVRGSNEVSQRMIDGFWEHLVSLSERIGTLLAAQTPFDASSLNES